MIVKITTSINNFVFCKPFAEKSIKPKMNSGFISISQKSELAALDVIVPYRGINGQTSIEASQQVLVYADSYAAAWAKKTYKVPGEEQEVILVPYQEILGVIAEEFLGE
jgi:hypothetical protein